MKHLRSSHAMLMCSAALWAFATPALAQTAAQPAAQPATQPAGANSNSTNSEEIVVTAQRRSERLIDTPQSVTALTAKDLAKLNALQFLDYANTVPGLQFTTAGVGRTSINLRGVTTGTDVSQTVGIYVDDVPYGSTSIFAAGSILTLDSGLYDLDRVEVLRGPQGTLYGASSVGGVLKYVTRAPSLTDLDGSVQAGVAGTHDGGTSYNGDAVLNVPVVTDKIAIRASGYYSHSGGYIDDLTTGQKNVDAADVYGGRVDILMKPTDDLTIRVTGYGQNIRRNYSLYSDYNRVTGKPIDGALDQAHPLAEPFASNYRVISGTIGYDFGFSKLTSITSYQSIGNNLAQDLSALYAPLLQSIGLPVAAAETTNRILTRKFTQEVRLASQGNHAVEWLVGAFYTHETSAYQQDLPIFDASLNLLPITLSNLSLPSTYQEYAAFANLTWHLTDKFDVTGGLRYAHNHQSFQQIASGLLAASEPVATSSEGVVTYLANARYHFTPNVMAYLRFATGYRPGGPNTQIVDPVSGALAAPATFKSDQLYSYEAGFKAETSDHSFAIDASGYYINWKNIQIGTAVDGVAAYLNAGDAHIKGAELTLTARPERGTTITGAFAYNDGYLTEANAALGAAAGERLPNSAHFTGTANADYVLASNPLKPSIGATVRYVGARTASFDGSAGLPNYRLPDYVATDLRASMTIGPVDAQIYVHNLFDTRGQLSASTLLTSFGGPAEVAIMQPRTFGISATTHF